MGCQIFDTTGSNTFTWPEGVTRAVVACRGAGGRGGVVSSGGGIRSGGGGGGGAFAERLVLKTDATAAVVVGIGGHSGVPDGGDASFIQSSSVVEYCLAAGGKGAVTFTGGVRGKASDSYGSITYDGGDGGNALGTHDGGAGGGSSAGSSVNGNAGANSNGSGLGQPGGTAPAGGFPGGDGGDEGFNGHTGPGVGSGGGGSGADTGSLPGDGGNGYVSVCWEDPQPTGYCINDNCNNWWPRCGYYRYGKQCFYYGYYGYGPYLYDHGWPISCCSGTVFSSRLKVTVTDSASGVTQAVDLVATSILAGGDHTYRAHLATPIDGGSINYVWLILGVGAQCTIGWSFGPGIEEIGAPSAVLSCAPLYLQNNIGADITVIITE